MSDSTHGAHGPGGHETRDVTFRPIVAASIGLAVLVLAAILGMAGLFGYLASREAKESAPERPLAAEFAPRLPPEPRLQAVPIQDLRELRAAESAILERYGWVDREQGVVHIPIDRAIELLARRGAGSAGANDGR